MNKKEEKQGPHSGFFPKNQRGQGLSTNAIILIVLGVVILVILILGFTMGWDKIAPWISKNNVDTVINQCSIACSTNSVYDYCVKARELKADGLPGGVKSVKGNCSYFSNASNTDYVKYRIAPCQSITCTS